MAAARNEILREVFGTMSLMKRMMHSHFSHAFEHSRISPSEVQLLTIIKARQPITPTALAEKMQLTPGAISQLLDGLYSSRCISRARSEADRRVNYLSITKTGQHKLAQVDKIREQMLTEAFSTLSDDELRNYLLVQQKIVRYFEDKRLSHHH